ncbi:GDP-Man:Man(3)GlcNAc(2)-PP-Dol alpha-1,2-mannosyltransferase [Diplogelasinospora grovesii]|uniref:GDP-Man:Man(3)GlcNAc(2)-PP-Dol alpha-1,2-mannosyltransferase n=1 Tax=Diplogelasinospora grovesii TaxID=303347 RepID=A0AAN6SAV9_9PEZI|nr:GDP-Man:Man(3)GlcNAc(2)-PP-Dol alpha-1,2-mannosyltransferase [Diplogelasinospora grovesii]
MADRCAAPGGRTPFSFGIDPKILAFVIVPLVAMTPLVTLFGIPLLWRAVGSMLGWYLRRKTDGRRSHLLELMEEDEKKYQKENEKKRRDSDDDEDEKEWEKLDVYTVGTSKNGDKADKDWDGIVGFFHPFCNAGGGGERVLWAAIRATQKRWPKAKCIVYTGDHDVTKDAILARVENRFNIHLHPPTINFLYLSTRHWVLASTWPHFTLAGQSIGSIIMAWDAFSLLVPDVFVDTMGYAFALGLSKFFFRDVPTGAYVHYPTISTDMLDSLDPKSAVGGQGVNAGKGAGTKGLVKKLYWQLFAKIYSWMGSSADVVMTNSTWTQGHIRRLWGPLRNNSLLGGRKSNPIAVVYPPVAVRELEHEIEVSEASESLREKGLLLYIAQFRPEKNHQLILQSFAEFVKTGTEAAKTARLVLVGSVRDGADSKRVYKLRLLVDELHIRDRVEFHLDASWPEILEWLRKASVGVNGMWNEHFGIGVVEYQAAGLISVVHDSGGPKLDIVVDVDGQPTGFHATTSTEFAQAFEKALSLPDTAAVRQRARQSAKRFTEEEFAKKWTAQMEKLVHLRAQDPPFPVGLPLLRVSLLPGMFR